MSQPNTLADLRDIAENAGFRVTQGVNNSLVISHATSRDLQRLIDEQGETILTLRTRIIELTEQRDDARAQTVSVKDFQRVQRERNLAQDQLRALQDGVQRALNESHSL